MSDQGFREIQLGGKQVVFLFLLLAVALVGTFLLGVSAGRGASPVITAAQATPAPAEPVGENVPLPPATTPGLGELKYPGALQEKSGKPGTPVETTPTPTATAQPMATATPSPTPQQKFPGTPPAPASAPPKASASETYFVQVNSFSTHDHAMKEVAKLRSLQITGTIVNAPGGGAHFKVRVGPLDKSAADALTARLRKQGYKPSVIR